MEITDERFEVLKDRYLRYLLFMRKSYLDKSRNNPKAHEMHGYGDYINYYNYEDLDEFSQQVSISFSWGYDMGMSMMDILLHLVNEVRSAYLTELAQRPSIKTVKVRKRIFGLPLPFAKYYETYDYKGKLIERFNIKRDLSIKNFKNIYRSIQSMESEGEEISKNELNFILVNSIVKKEYLFQKPNEMKCNIISPEETDMNEWFKTMIKFKAKEQYAKEVYAAEFEPTKQEIIKQNREKRKPSTKLVKWVDIDDKKNKNNFTKLIYALHRAGYLQGEVTKMVGNLAPVFDIEMADWKSNFSKGCTGPSIGYNHGAFFDKLKDSYIEIVAEKIEKQKLNKKTKANLINTQDSGNSEES